MNHREGFMPSLMIIIQVKVCHLCLGRRQYNLWSYFWFTALSADQLVRLWGRSDMSTLLSLLIAVMSRGRPLSDILPITQAPSRVLRNVCQREYKQQK